MCSHPPSAALVSRYGRHGEHPTEDETVTSFNTCLCLVAEELCVFSVTVKKPSLTKTICLES